MAASQRVLPLLCVVLLTTVTSQQTSPSLPAFPEDEVYAYSYQSSTQISRDVSVDLTAEVSFATKLHLVFLTQ